MLEQTQVEGQITTIDHDHDRAAVFGRLLDAELLRNYRLASVILGNRLDAEDATHDAALRAWKRLDSLHDHQSFGAWFQRILINICRRRIAKRRPSIFSIEDEAADPIGAIAEQDALARAMVRLTLDHRTVIALRYLEDLSEAQIAQRTGIRIGTVKSRLHYALSALRAAYEADARDAGGSV